MSLSLGGLYFQVLAKFRVQLCPPVLGANCQGPPRNTKCSDPKCSISSEREREGRERGEEREKEREITAKSQACSPRAELLYVMQRDGVRPASFPLVFSCPLPP